MKWYHIKKSFQGGRSEHYMFFPDETPQDEVDSAVKYWGEHSNGGHAYGYDLKWEDVDGVSKEVITNNIHKLNDQQESLMRAKLNNEFDIKALQAELVKLG